MKRSFVNVHEIENFIPQFYLVERFLLDYTGESSKNSNSPHILTIYQDGKQKKYSSYAKYTTLNRTIFSVTVLKGDHTFQESSILFLSVCNIVTFFQKENALAVSKPHRMKHSQFMSICV